MSERERIKGETDKERQDTKKQPKGGVIDGIGGMGGSSGAGGLRANPDYVGNVSGIDAEVDSDEIPMPGSTGKGGPAAGRTGHVDQGMSGKNRGSDYETEPTRGSGRQED